MKKILLLIALSVSSWAVQADPKLCQVEILVFQHNVAQSQLQETWSSNTPLPTFSSSQIPQPATIDDPKNRLVEKSQLKLIAEHKRLAQNRRYTVLMHLAWTQAITSASATTPVHVYTRAPQSLSEMGELGEYSEGMLLDGTVSISQAKKMRTQVNFVLNTNNVSSRLHQQGFLSLGELYYFDHPLYGMVVRITPV